MAKVEWFETVAHAQRLAAKRLPKSVYSALVAGSERGITVEDNLAAFGELGFAPHVAGLSAKRDLSTTVMGQPISMPLFISPTGVQAVHPDGEVAVAAAAAACGTAMCLSSFASKPVEDVRRPTRRRSSRCTGPATARRCSPEWNAPARQVRSD